LIRNGADYALVMTLAYGSKSFRLFTA